MSDDGRRGSCGPHTELFSGPAVRVTRCACGTVHMTLPGQGLTVRLSSEALHAVSAGLRTAVERVEAAAPSATCVN